MEDVIAEYRDMDLLIEKILYMKNIDYQYNSRNIVTNVNKRREFYHSWYTLPTEYLI